MIDTDRLVLCVDISKLGPGREGGVRAVKRGAVLVSTPTQLDFILCTVSVLQSVAIVLKPTPFQFSNPSSLQSPHHISSLNSS